MMEKGGKLQVIVRVRSAKQGNSEVVVDVNEPEGQVIIGLEKSFGFDTCFDGDATQDRVYRQSIAPLVESFVKDKSHHSSILAYGQTGAGKTYTMFGKEDDEGIIPKALKDIFEKINLEEDSIGVSFFEIYNEKLFDLMNSNKIRVPLVLREEGPHFHIPTLTTKWVSNFEEAMEAVKHGCSTRSTGSTAQNQESSRSHAIFRLTLANVTTGQRKEFKMNMVDLAGSESVSRTHANGARLGEANNINKGLLALGNCICAISEKKGHIPFRDSTLTKVLRECFQGDGLTTFIACVSPTENDIGETLSTIRYADRAKNMKKPPIPKNILDQAQASAKKRRLAPLMSATPGKLRANHTFNGATPSSQKRFAGSFHRLNSSTPADMASPSGYPFFPTGRKVPLLPDLEESDEMSDFGSISDLTSLPGGPTTSSMISACVQSSTTNILNNQSTMLDASVLSPMVRRIASEVASQFSEMLEKKYFMNRQSPRLLQKTFNQTKEKTLIDGTNSFDAEETVVSALKTKQNEALMGHLNQAEDDCDNFQLKKVSGLQDRANQQRKRSHLVQASASPQFTDSEDKENKGGKTPKRAKTNQEQRGEMTPPVSEMASRLGIDLNSPSSFFAVPSPNKDRKKSNNRRSLRRTTMMAPELRKSLSQAGVISDRRRSARLSVKENDFKNPFDDKSNWREKDQERLHKHILDMLNFANLSMLQRIPAIGPKSAYLIHSHKERNKGLQKLEDLKTIPGLQKNFFAKFCVAHQLEL